MTAKYSAEFFWQFLPGLIHYGGQKVDTPLRFFVVGIGGLEGTLIRKILLSLGESFVDSSKSGDPITPDDIGFLPCYLPLRGGAGELKDVLKSNSGTAVLDDDVNYGVDVVECVKSCFKNVSYGQHHERDAKIQGRNGGDKRLELKARPLEDTTVVFLVL